MITQESKKPNIERLIIHFTTPQSHVRKRNADAVRRAEEIGREIYNSTMRGKIPKSKKTNDA